MPLPNLTSDDVFALMRFGMALGVPRSGDGPHRLFRVTVGHPKPEMLPDEQDVPATAFPHLRDLGLITELTESFDRANVRNGWRELELPGETYRLFLRNQ